MLQQDELSSLSPDDLMAELKKARLQHYKLLLEKSMNQLKETHKLKVLRNYIQKLQTRKNFLKREAKVTKPTASKS